MIECLKYIPFNSIATDASNHGNTKKCFQFLFNTMIIWMVELKLNLLISKIQNNLRYDLDIWFLNKINLRKMPHNKF